MSYVNKKIGAFREAGDIEVQLNRSDGRMKVYASATDARAWCDISEDRRQYILELVKRDYGKVSPVHQKLHLIFLVGFIFRKVRTRRGHHRRSASQQERRH